MNPSVRRLLLGLVVSTLSAVAVFGERAADSQQVPAGVPAAVPQSIPDKEFSHPPERPHGPGDLVFNFNQLDHFYRVPGEFTHRLTGDQ